MYVPLLSRDYSEFKFCVTGFFLFEINWIWKKEVARTVGWVCLKWGMFWGRLTDSMSFTIIKFKNLKCIIYLHHSSCTEHKEQSERIVCVSVKVRWVPVGWAQEALPSVLWKLIIPKPWRQLSSAPRGSQADCVMGVKRWKSSEITDLEVFYPSVIHLVYSLPSALPQIQCHLCREDSEGLKGPEAP